MFIIRFSGGLGNQMFQQALCFVLQEKYPDATIKVDCEHYRLYQVHNGYEMKSCFGIQNEIATIKEIRKVSNRFACRIPLKIFPPVVCNVIEKQYAKIYNKNRNIISQPSFNAYDNHIFQHLDVKLDYYVQGEWQNWSYFDVYENMLRKKFIFKTQFTNKQDLKWRYEIEHSNSVGIHMRRGDFVNSSYHDLCDMVYYTEAIELIKQYIRDPKLFVFSDDIEYAKLQFGIYHSVTFVQHSTSDAKIDMQLMSLCKYNIIPNSTFSFWAAMLNSNSCKIVICPQFFLKENDVWYEFKVPQSWIKINNKR